MMKAKQNILICVIGYSSSFKYLVRDCEKQFVNLRLWKVEASKAGSCLAKWIVAYDHFLFSYLHVSTNDTLGEYLCHTLTKAGGEYIIGLHNPIAHSRIKFWSFSFMLGLTNKAFSGPGRQTGKLP